jgi:hypothetical protein
VLLLIVALTIGFSLGASSIAFFLGRVWSLTPFAIDAVMLILAGACAARWRSSHRDRRPQSIAAHRTSGLIERVIAGGFAVVAAGAIYAAIARAAAYATGWDAFAIWNLRARFLFRDAAHWRDGFTHLLDWSHPDYPLLLPASIAHVWTAAGHEGAAVPATIGLLFAAATVMLLVGAVSFLRGLSQALLAGTVLLSTPLFVEQSAWQYADVPLGFFVLATMVLLCMDSVTGSPKGPHYGRQGGSREPPHASGWLAFAGLAAAFGAWTKNEGLLVLVALIALMLIRRRPLLPFLAGAAPVLLVLAFFKFAIAPSSDLFPGPDRVIHAIGSPQRYLMITSWIVRDAWNFGQWLVPVTALLAIYGALVGRAEQGSERAAVTTAMATLVITLVGFAAVYVITPLDLEWHLRFSLNRLFLQLWPSALFIFFITIRTPEEAFAPAVHSEPCAASS